MSVGMIFRLTSIVAFGAGAALTLAPEPILAAWGAEASPLMLFQARQEAALILAAGMLFWVARDSEPSLARRAIIVGGFWAGVFIAFVWLDGVASGTVPMSGVVGLIAGILIAAVFAGAGAAEVGRRTARPDEEGGPGGAGRAVEGGGSAVDSPGPRGGRARGRTRGSRARRRRQAGPGSDSSDGSGSVPA